VDGVTESLGIYKKLTRHLAMTGYNNGGKRIGRKFIYLAITSSFISEKIPCLINNR
jgi:hypothetical protein